jgi:2-deoxy-D-gluconate 3-dehydrogenase
MADWGPFSLNGKNAVVTGGAMGIGRGIVERLAEAGANVIVADMDGGAATTTANEVTAKGGGRAVALQLNCTASSAGDQIVAACVKEFGSIDILANNAGIYPQVPMLNMDEALWDKVQAVNLKGLAFISKAVATKMIEQGTGGAIVNTASIDGIHPSMVGLAAYDASKGGVIMFTKNFALEVAPHGIRVNAVAPGAIATPGTAAPLEGSGMTQADLEAMMQAFTAKIPLARQGGPDDIGKVVAFLASSAAGYMTGETVVVDGGYLLS